MIDRIRLMVSKLVRWGAPSGLIDPYPVDLKYLERVMVELTEEDRSALPAIKLTGHEMEIAHLFFCAGHISCLHDAKHEILLGKRLMKAVKDKGGSGDIDLDNIQIEALEVTAENCHSAGDILKAQWEANQTRDKDKH